jgi:beta-glucosidase
VTRFPAGFLWGAATAAYQIEGAVDEDGRGPSIWDRFSHTPGAVALGQTGDIACDHYHRLAADLDVMAGIGLTAYRFSIAWPRIQPDGAGTVNQRGLDFYRRLVDGLLERGIAPVATLYHWDLPAALQDRVGGWAGRETALRFAEYAAVAFEALGDRVGTWVTVNEPQVAAFTGHLDGRHAPGIRDLRTAIRAAHHLLLGHGLAVEAFRASGSAGDIGISLNLNPVDPAGDDEADRRAATLFDGYLNRWFLDPLFRASYPVDAADHLRAVAGDLGPDLGCVEADDLATIAAPLDFLGVNYYFRNIVGAAPLAPSGLGWEARRAPDGAETTSVGWAINPDGLADLFGRLRAEYPRLPIYVTENGISLDDKPGPDGRLDDPRRIDYIRRHLEVAADAIGQGTDLRGWFVWTLIDNFEWALGYRPRFGLVHVDYATQRRTPKASARWYAEVIARNGV